MKHPLLLTLLCAAAVTAEAAEPAPGTSEHTRSNFWSGVATNAQGQLLATVSSDTSEAPDLDDWGKRAGELCTQWYPKIIALLPSDGFTAPKDVRLKFKKEYRGVAATGGSTISISASYVRGHTNDWGMVIHELTHVVQGYGRPEPGFTKPGWLTEGIADYIRLTHFEPEARRPKLKADKETYKGSYKPTAIFLEWVEKSYDKELVSKLNRALRARQFKLELFKDYTGKTVEELGEAFAETLKPKEAKSAAGQ